MPVNINFKLLSIMVTSLCTRRCNSCTMQEWMDNQKYHLSITQINNLIETCKKSKYYFKTISLSGGDPLVWQNLEEGIYLLLKSGITDFMQLQTNGDAINEYNAKAFDQVFSLLNYVRISEYNQNKNYIVNNKKLIKSILPKSYNIVKFADRTSHWELPKIKYSGSLPADCYCGHYTLFGDEIWICGSVLPMSLRFKTDVNESYKQKVASGCMEKLIKVDKFSQEHCMFCPINKKIIKKLKRVAE